MNVFKIALLAALLWLTGCATQSNPTPQASTPETRDPGVAATDAPRAKPASVYSTGPLAPINEQNTRSRNVANLSPPADMWERVRRGFAMPDLSNDLVRDREQWYSARPDYIYRMTERSRKYLFYIVEELELRDMPTELALLPFVESAFNPQAVSSAKAAGMWQFMPATGKTFELKQNVFRDDRRDVLASTRAALDYLQKLYRMFGDWQLALAAYNWGEGSVARAIAKNKAAGLPTGYSDLNMPMETRFYVPKLQAIKNIVASPGAFNSRLPQIGNHPYFQTVTLQRDIDVVLAAKLAEVPLEDFKALNPAQNKPVIMVNGTPQILLPWDNAAIFQNNLEGYTGGRLASWTVWLAPTTLRPAEVAQKVGMSEAEFRAINDIPARMLIKAGSALLVPRGVHIQDDVTGSVADSGQIALAPEVVLKRTTVKAGKADTVASIAQKYRVSPENVAQWNGVSTSARFKAKQAVVLFLPSGGARRVAAEDKPEPGKSSTVASQTAPAKPGKNDKPPKSGDTKKSANAGKPDKTGKADKANKSGNSARANNQEKTKTPGKATGSASAKPGAKDGSQKKG